MKTVQSSIAIALIVFATAAGAGESKAGHKKHKSERQQQSFEYAKVVNVQPLYREVRVSNPVRECWDEPVYHTENRRSNSAGGMLAGGLIGGIIGHQFGQGRGNKLATAVGTMIGAQVGHDAVNGKSHTSQTTIAGYREQCDVRHQVSYEEVLDGYDVTYKFRGQRFQVEMPYHPGKRIKMRIEFSPVI